MNVNYVVSFVLFLCIWTAWGYFSSKVEQAEYVVLSSADEYEIREYPVHLVAQTTVTGDYRDALNEGFRIVAGYIFGGNTKRESIAMTAPVTDMLAEDAPLPPVDVAMTAPVVASLEGSSHVISFGMPKVHTKDTLPIPTDSRVKIVEVPAQKMAVIRYSWYSTATRVQSMKNALLTALARDRVEVAGDVYYAGYNAPWTPPWLLRHEVMVTLK